MNKSAILYLCCLFGYASPQGFVFPGSENVPRQGPEETNCKPINQCKALMEILDSNPNGLSEFDSCGFDGETPLFECPASLAEKDECVCKSVMDCPDFAAIARKKDFDELRKHRRCGFRSGSPMYCCPSKIKKPPRRRVLKQPTGIEVVNRIDALDEDVSNCGISNGLKIFGGTNADEHEFPWAVVLVYVHPVQESRMYLCGGTLVSNSWVLTAAHCINSRQGHHLAKIRLGHSNLTHEDSFDVDLESITLHPDYTQFPVLMNDLAMLKLSRPLETTSNVRPVCLSKDDDDDEEEIVEPVVAGWGLVNSTNTTEYLQKLRLNITDNVDCENIYQAKIEGLFIEDSQICATGLPGTDSCKGDSGGPLMYLDSDSRYRIVGVTSFGTIKCDSSVPGVYSRISFYKDWIQSVITS